MRLRQLGSTQSIAFFAPPEVHQSIVDVCQKFHGGVFDSSIINSSHVVCWLMEQTCRANGLSHDLYLAQGMNFCRRTNAQRTSEMFLSQEDHRKSYLEVIQQIERQTLEQLYGVPGGPLKPFNTSVAELKGFMEELDRQKKANCLGKDFIHSSIHEEIEQEREVEFQVEHVRQMEKPSHYEALKFPGLHKAISRYAEGGELTGKNGYEHFFDALSRTSIGQKYHIRRTTSRLFVSTEFMRTIKSRGHLTNHDFLVSSQPPLFYVSSRIG